HPNIAPYGETFKCKDGKLILLAVGSDSQFAELCNILDISDVAEDHRFKHNPARVENRLSLAEKLRPAIAQRASEELSDQFVTAGVPAGIVRSIDQVLSDPSVGHLLVKDEVGHRVTQVPFVIE
ncbi:MAG: CoA transferase, partial [Flavobacteriales bacterium]|nr:CoA transferase [Flavobacteriales bacterium]